MRQVGLCYYCNCGVDDIDQCLGGFDCRAIPQEELLEQGTDFCQRPATTFTPHTVVDRAYDAFRASLPPTIARSVGVHQLVFQTSAEGLWETFLGFLPAAARQHDIRERQGTLAVLRVRRRGGWEHFRIDRMD